MFGSDEALDVVEATHLYRHNLLTMKEKSARNDIPIKSNAYNTGAVAYVVLPFIIGSSAPKTQGQSFVR